MIAQANPVQKQHSRTRTVAAGVCGLCLILAIISLGMTLRSRVPVFRGYYLYWENSTSNALYDSNNALAIDQEIVLLGISGDLIVGKTEDPGMYANPWWSFPVGYFVVDSLTGKVTSGLSQSQFEKIVGANGKVPSLHSPLYWSFTSWW